MADKPDWLPEMLDIVEATDEVVDALYVIFDRDLKQGHPKFGNRSIIFSLGKSVKGYEVIFWHLITGSYHPPSLEAIEIERAQRLPWCAPTINNALGELPLVWDYEEGDGKVRTYIWLQQFDYVVIVQKEHVVDEGDIARLITAYCTNEDWGRRKLDKKYNNRIGA
jgi:hypothetical protein